MLAKDERVTEAAVFHHVFKEGVRNYGRQFAVYAAPNDVGTSRFGFIVNKKVGNSVVRHRVVRQLREVAQDFPKDKNIDFVVVAKPAIVFGFKPTTLTKALTDLSTQVSK